MRRTILILLLLLAPAAAMRAAPPPVLPQAPLVTGTAQYPAFHPEGAEQNKLEISVAPASGPGFDTVLRVQTREECSSPLAAQIMQATREPIKKGDILWAHFLMRTTASSVESGEGTLEFIFEEQHTFAKSAQFTARALQTWKEFFVPFTARADFPAGGASIIFRAGYKPQTVEIGGLEIRNFGTKMKLADLPASPDEFKYEGMAPNAPWRAEAQQRIDKIRKADLTVAVLDAKGRPVPNAHVSIRQKNHAYLFGSAVRAEMINGEKGPEETARYRAALRELFNVVTFENNLKWPSWLTNQDAPLTADKWLEENGIALRGHNLVWPSRRHMPESLRPLLDDPEALRKAVLDHIAEVTARVKPDPVDWDVLNETFSNHDFMDVLGRDEMVAWFEAARKGAPGSRLFINDYGIINGGGLQHDHQDDYEKTIAFLIAKNAPLDGIGLQGHIGKEPTPPDLMLKLLDRYGKFGKELQMTEYSCQVLNPDAAAGYLRDILTVFFSHPSTTAFILWGFKDGSGMSQKSYLYDANWKITPSGKVWKDLIYHQWWTNAETKTAADGTAAARGFDGLYEITVKKGALKAVAQVELKPGGSTVNIQLPVK